VEVKIVFELKDLVVILSVLVTASGAFISLYRVGRKIEKSIDRIAIHNTDIQMLIRSNMVSLDGLEQLGANGIVSKTKSEISEYLIMRAGGKL
jgi:hypothetical protein